MGTPFTVRKWYACLCNVRQMLQIRSELILGFATVGLLVSCSFTPQINTKGPWNMGRTFGCIGVIIVCLVVPANGGQTPSSEPYQASSTKEMGELLVKLHADQDAATDPTKDAERAAALQIKLVGDLPWQEDLRTRWTLAENLLRAGDSAGAVKQLQFIRKRCNELSVRLGPNSEQQLRDLLGLAYLRLGEQENCVQHHVQKSCIFPLEPEAVHTNKSGAEGAIREYTATLQRDPQNML